MNKKKAILALALLVPAPSIGALCGMVIFPDSLLGVLLFGFSKVWLFSLPVFWRIFIDKKPISFSPARHGGFIIGLLSGLGILGIILTAYLTIGDSLIDKEFMIGKLTSIGLASHGVYIGAAAYWILINSVLEEYVWRWFCVKKCEQFMRPTLAVICSALFFTLHHIVAMQVYFGTTAVLICSFGIFIGGAIWSAMYIKYRSIWPGYLSHAIVDLIIFGIGASMLF